MTNTTEQKTGIIKAVWAISKQLEMQSGPRRYAEKRVTRELMDEIAGILSDGRTYVVQVLPVLNRPGDMDFTQIVRQAFVWLANATDAQVGEFCAVASIQFREESYALYDRKTDTDFAFRRVQFQDGNGKTIWAWQRVE